MDLNEAVQRILRRHWFLIVLMTAIGVSIPAAMIRMEHASYVATARIVIGATDTRDGQEATALADTALALATEIVRMRDEAVFAPTQQQLTETVAALAALDTRIADIERAADETVARLESVDALALEHAQAMEQRSSLESQRQQLVQALTVAVRPRVIDASSTAGELVPAARATRLGLSLIHI